MPHRSDFGTPCCLRPTEAGSALGFTPFEATFTFTVVTARQLVVSPRETLSIGFRILISLHPAIQTTGRLTFAPAGLPPAEHTSLTWTHFRTAGFPQYGWKVGFPSGAFLDRRQLKPAPGMRSPPSSLHPPFVHLGVNAVIPHCVGPQTRLRTAMEGYYSSTPGVLARVRVIVSRSVITYATPSVPLVGTPRFHRKAAYTRCLRCAGAPRLRLGGPRAVPGFRCSFLPDMPPSMTSGSSIIVSVQNTDVDIGLRHGPKDSALPIVPQSVSRGARFSRLHWFATATACQVAGPPVRI
jgi:hypothetical protein